VAVTQWLLASPAVITPWAPVASKHRSMSEKYWMLPLANTGIWTLSLLTTNRHSTSTANVDLHASVRKRFYDSDLWTHDLENLKRSWPHSGKYLCEFSFKSLQWFMSHRIHKILLSSLADLDLDLWPCDLRNVITVMWTGWYWACWTLCSLSVWHKFGRGQHQYTLLRRSNVAL